MKIILFVGILLIALAVILFIIQRYRPAWITKAVDGIKARFARKDIP